MGPQCPAVGKVIHGQAGGRPVLGDAGGAAVAGAAKRDVHVVPGRRQLLQAPLGQAAAEVGGGVGGQRWEPRQSSGQCCSQQARLKCWARTLGFFVSSKLWMFGCTRPASGSQDSHQTLNLALPAREPAARWVSISLEGSD